MIFGDKQHCAFIKKHEQQEEQTTRTASEAALLHVSLIEPAVEIDPEDIADYVDSFEEALDKQIVRNREVLDACDEIVERGLTPKAFAFLDIWDGHACQPSMYYALRSDRLEYLAEYLRLRPDDEGAQRLAETERLHETTQTDADVYDVYQEMYADALAVDEAQSEFCDWRS